MILFLMLYLWWHYADWNSSFSVWTKSGSGGDVQLNSNLYICEELKRNLRSTALTHTQHNGQTTWETGRHTSYTIGSDWVTQASRPIHWGKNLPYDQYCGYRVIETDEHFLLPSSAHKDTNIYKWTVMFKYIKYITYNSNISIVLISKH